MKKFLSCLLAVCLMVMLVACGKTQTEEKEQEKAATTEAKMESQPTIHGIGDFVVQAEEEHERYVFTFAVYDEGGNTFKAPAVVHLQIVNDADATVYTVTKHVTEEDYAEWGSPQTGVSLKAAVHINYSDITVGVMESGKLHYEVLDALEQGGLSGELDIFGLPATGDRVEMPNVPCTIYDYMWDDAIDSAVRITDVTYEISGTSLCFYFTGEKMYDSEGSGHSQSCQVGWKLYDGEGYVVASGVFYSPAIKEGEKFRNEKEYVSIELVRGETYKLVLENVA